MLSGRTELQLKGMSSSSDDEEYSSLAEEVILVNIFNDVISVLCSNMSNQLIAKAMVAFAQHRSDY